MKIDLGLAGKLPGDRRYVGFCYDSKAWRGDLTGLLLVEEGAGWAQAGSHISSNEGWSSRDIRAVFDRRAEPKPDDTYEWAGLLTIEEAAARFQACARSRDEP